MTSVCITGFGAVAATGRGADTLIAAARTGRSGLGPIEFPVMFGNRILTGGRIPADVPVGEGEPKVRWCDRFSLLALMATREAVGHAKLDGQNLTGHRTGLIIGSGIGGMQTIEDNQSQYYFEKKNPDPLAIPKIMPNAGASQVAMALGCTGPTFAIATACATSTQTLGLAYQLIRAGIIDRALAGGSEAILTPATMRCWEMMRVLTPNLCRPFDKRRSGMVVGEGAGTVILESEESANARGAPILGRILGYGTTNDAGDLVRPDPVGAAAAMNIALEDAKISASDVAYINAHGTGALLNDRSEADAITSVFGTPDQQPMVSSTKPLHGHCLGGTGVLEAIITLGALREGFVPGTINVTEPDPACSIKLVAGESVPLHGTIGLSNSFAFGGINATLVLEAVNS